MVLSAHARAHTHTHTHTQARAVWAYSLPPPHTSTHTHTHTHTGTRSRGLQPASSTHTHSHSHTHTHTHTHSTSSRSLQPADRTGESAWPGPLGRPAFAVRGAGSPDHRLLYDIIHYIGKRSIPGLLLLINFVKAFDIASWSFVKEMLSFFRFGFDKKKWIGMFYKIQNHVCCQRTILCLVPNGKGQ